MSTLPSRNSSVAVAGVLLAVCPSTTVSTAHVLSRSGRSGSAPSRSVSTSVVSPAVSVRVGPSSRQRGPAPRVFASQSSCAWRGGSQPLSGGAGASAGGGASSGSARPPLVLQPPGGASPPAAGEAGGPP